MINTIQGSDAVLFFKKDDTWLPYVCTTTVEVDINADTIQTRTAKDGQWKRFTYQALAYQVVLSGVMVFDASNFDTWEVVDNQLNALTLMFRLICTHADGTIKSFQGEALIQAGSLTAAIGDVVKNTFTMQGNGRLYRFDGVDPCPSTISDLSVSGLTDPSGNIGISYAFSGMPSQIKYRMDGTGDYVYTGAGSPVTYFNLPVGTHSVEIIPVCANDLEGTGASISFNITLTLTCPSVITSINVATDASTATMIYTGPATQMRYSIDGGTGIVVPITQVISLTGLSAGSHTIVATPLCVLQDGSLLPGTGHSTTFTSPAQPTQSVNAFSFTNPIVAPGRIMGIYVNGTLRYNPAATTGPTVFTVPIGQSVSSIVQATSSFFTAHSVRLVVTRNGTIVFDQTITGNGTLKYTYAADGANYVIAGTIN